ncbi:MAG: 30S ribosomal protein S13 [Planctomycetaceae bacterium]
MPRIMGVDIPPDKPAWVSLGYLYGIGDVQARRVLVACAIDPNRRARDLTEEEVAKLAAEIEKNHVVEGHLRRQITSNLQRLKEIGCYRGIRHRKGLPVRGQRTRTNARTRKGPRKTVAGKKSVKEKK